MTSIRFRPFQSTLPAGEATMPGPLFEGAHDDFNPRFPRGKRHKPGLASALTVAISIHASRGGSDCLLSAYVLSARFQSTLPAGEATKEAPAQAPKKEISIHASRGGSDMPKIDIKNSAPIFQSTLPAGEATNGPHWRPTPIDYFNPRFPRGKRPPKAEEAKEPPKISIHASRGGSDAGR